MACTYAISRVIDEEKPHAREVIFSIGFAEYKVTLQAIMRDFSEGLRYLYAVPSPSLYKVPCYIIAQNGILWVAVKASPIEPFAIFFGKLNVFCFGLVEVERGVNSAL